MNSTHLDNEVEQVYDEFWKSILETDGELNIDQVKKELHDFHYLITSVPEVYSHVTGGHVSKPMTEPGVVCSLADEHYEGLAEPRQFPESEWQVGDVISRSGTDEQLILEVLDDQIRCVCIADGGWDELMSEETNLKRRYHFVRRPSEEN